MSDVLLRDMLDFKYIVMTCGRYRRICKFATRDVRYFVPVYWQRHTARSLCATPKP